MGPATMKTRPACRAEGRRAGQALLLLALVFAAGCGDGGEQPAEEPAAEPEAELEAEPEAEPEAGVEAGVAPDRGTTAPDAPAAAWTPPDGFTVVVPALGQETYPRLIRHGRTGVELLIVPAGTFELGSTTADPGHASDEGPARAVELSAFYLARTEVTLSQWTRGGGDAGRAAGLDHPVVDVTWYDAQAWCRANGLALPSEAQWEYAASGPENRTYPWGEEDEAFRANALGTLGPDRWDDTAPVGSFPRGASWCSAYDLAGNVAEWCRDTWYPNYDGMSAERDPVRQGGEGTHVVRGGSFSCRPPYCLRTAYRDGIDPSLKGGNLGFRVVLAL